MEVREKGWIMNKRYEVLAAGVAAVDDLLYVSEYPAANVKVPITRSARHGGGLACTAAAAVSRLGGRCAYAARFGEDELSNFIEKALVATGVDTSAIVRDPEGQPFHSVIVVDGSGARTAFYDASHFRPLGADDLSDALISSAEVVVLDYLVDPPMIDLARKVRGLGVGILADIEGRSASCLPLLELVDYLIVSEEFARWRTKIDDLPGACAHLAQEPRRATVVTAGAQGCYLATSPGSAPEHVPAFRVDAADTTGCGDTFHGAFALAVARQLSMEDSAIFASAAAALKASGKGGWGALPTAGEVAAFLQQRLPGEGATRRILEAQRAPR